ncbi:MAG TPA: S41 family peptidase [Puia sp.]|jgi:hypothetical protein|nr:S41 family peptidase [Puia sp.]
MKYCRSIALLLLIMMTACKKEISNPINNQPVTTFSQVFDDFWNKMNVNYLYWNIDTTQWNAMYSRYKPVFDKLQLNESADLARSVGYFREMTEGLIDHHYSIAFTNPSLKDSTINPAVDHLLKDPSFRNPYSFITSDEHFVDAGYLYGYDNTITPGKPLITLSGTIHGNILFFACNQFELSASFHSALSGSIQSSLNYLFDHLQNTSGLKAIILDIRDNQGGAVSDLNFLAGRFIDAPLPFGYTRYKSGNGTLDYTPWISASVLPQPGAQAVKLPILILADRYSASMAEILTMALRTLPQCRVIGETTFGATGPLTENAIYNDGAFDVQGFMSVETSSTAFKYLDGKMYEGKGFSPDYPVAFSSAALAAGDDPQLDKALSLVQ